MQRVSTPDFWEFYRAEFSPAEERSFRHRQTDAVSRPATAGAGSALASGNHFRAVVLGRIVALLEGIHPRCITCWLISFSRAARVVVLPLPPVPTIKPVRSLMISEKTDAGWSLSKVGDLLNPSPRFQIEDQTA